MSERPKVQHSKCCVVQATPGSNPGATAINSRHAMRGGIFVSDGGGRRRLEKAGLGVSGDRGSKPGLGKAGVNKA